MNHSIRFVQESLSHEASKKILGINEDVSVAPHDMARTLIIAFFPHDAGTVSPNILHFAENLTAAFARLHVRVLPFADALERVPLALILKRSIKIIANNILVVLSFLVLQKNERIWIPFSVFRYLARRQKIKRGISVIALGELPVGNLPIDHTASFRESSVVTILDMPANISRETDFSTHFDTAMSLFAYHMSNIIIMVRGQDWLLYNFNASHPFYRIDKDFDAYLLSSLIPKLAAPMRPHTLRDFTIDSQPFDPEEEPYRALVRDMREGGALLEQAGLYPPGKKITDLPFRNRYYRWIGRVHLDNRSGMSYGFLARQIPVEIPEVYSLDSAKTCFGHSPEDGGYFIHDGKLYVFFSLPGNTLCVRVPDVWVLTQRSGANKTKFNQATDLIVMGISQGNMLLRLPKKVKRLAGDFRPSYDTKVILAHAAGNAIAAAVLRFVFPKNKFSRMLEEEGAALAHWHGYLNPERIPEGWHVYGMNNPHVACSTAQAALYALQGKMRALQCAIQEKKEFFGDVHIEPQHGSNIFYSSLKELGEFFKSAPDRAALGNEYLDAYAQETDQAAFVSKFIKR